MVREEKVWQGNKKEGRVGELGRRQGRIMEEKVRWGKA